MDAPVGQSLQVDYNEAMWDIYHWMVPQTPSGKTSSSSAGRSSLGPQDSRLSRTESPFSTRKLSRPMSQKRISTRFTSMKVSKRLRVKRPFVLLYFVLVMPIRASISLRPLSTNPAMKHTTISFLSVVVTPNMRASPLAVQVSRETTMPIMAMSSVMKVSVVLQDWSRITMGQTIRPGLFVKRCTQQKGIVRASTVIRMQAGTMPTQYSQSMVFVGHFIDSCMLPAPKISIIRHPTRLRAQMARKAVLGWCGRKRRQRRPSRLMPAIARPTIRIIQKYLSRQLVYISVTMKVALMVRESCKNRSSTLKARLLA